MKLKTLFVLFLTVSAVGCWEPSQRSSSGVSSSNGGARVSTEPTKLANGANVRAEPMSAPTSNSSSKTMKEGFKANLPTGFTMPTDGVGLRMLREYGAMFVAKNVKPPTVVVFRDENEVRSFQSGVGSEKATIGGVEVELQPAALNALKEAVEEAKSKGLTITPRNADSSKRTYMQTVDNWKSRVDPGLANWVGKGKLAKADADRIALLQPSEQVAEIFKLEEQGMYFAKNFDKSIIYSVAPPGTSQHISMLALDVAEFDKPAVRSILSANGWFQTVTSDLPHFTYLGVPETQLGALGLKPVTNDNRTFWIPDLQ